MRDPEGASRRDPGCSLLYVRRSPLRSATYGELLKKLQQTGSEHNGPRAACVRLCRRLPKAEQFGLISQMQRASVSVPSNIAEGHANGPGARYRWHVRTALGSVAELDTQIEIIRRLDYLKLADIQATEQQLIRTRQLLHGLNRSLLRKQAGKALLAGAAFLGGTRSSCSERENRCL